VDAGLLISILIRLALGLGIGFITGMTGIGAAVLVVPSLIYAVGLPAVNAVGTGALYATLARSYASYEHLRLRTVRKRTAFYIALGGVPTVLVTSLIITHLAKTVGSGLDFALKVIIGVVILITWTFMLINVFKNRKGNSRDYYVPLKHFPVRRKLYGIAAGAGVGVLIGSTSIGGGVLIIPILVTVFRLSPNNTVGTSTLVSVLMSATAAFAYIMGGRTNPSVAVMMFIGAIPGVWLGCRLSVKVPHRVLEGILFAVVTISAIVMFAGIK
jgi:uncharacterized membrane protein YfcA